MLRTITAALLGTVLLLLAVPTVSAAETLDCVGEFTGTHDGNLRVPSGEFCIIIGAEVTGNVLVEDGALGFHSHGSIIGKNVIVEGVQLDVRILNSEVGGYVDIANSGNAGTIGAICASEIGGNVRFTNNAGVYALGATGFGGVCPEGDVIGGNLIIEDNAAHFVIRGEEVGRNLQLMNNTGGATLIANQVEKNLNCEGNVPPPAGAGNVAERKKGQCANL